MSYFKTSYFELLPKNGTQQRLESIDRFEYNKQNCFNYKLQNEGKEETINVAPEKKNKVVQTINLV
jgi:hypothetical protein